MAQQQQPPILSLAQGRYAGERLPASFFFSSSSSDAEAEVEAETETDSPSASAAYRAVDAFRGIPYAQSTAGPNRFRPPQPLSPPSSSSSGDDVLAQDARAFGPVCPQPRRAGQEDLEMGEDCLRVNIFRPVLDAEEDRQAGEDRDGRKQQELLLLPVLVYIHGGGFNYGHGGERRMDALVAARAAAAAATPCLGVSFNYRVGALGFPTSGAAARCGLLNLGLRDQHAALAWVRANVGAAGGDRRNVTVMGLSAGAHSVGHHLSAFAPANAAARSGREEEAEAEAEAEEAPFAKAILESGGPTARAVFYPDHPLHEEHFREFLSLCGLSPPSSPSASEEADQALFAALRALPLATLARASLAVWARWLPTLRWPFQPAIDGPGGCVPLPPLESWAAGRVLRVPLLTGYNSHEGAMFVSPTSPTSPPAAPSELLASVVPGLGAADRRVLDAALYPDAAASAAGRALYDRAAAEGYVGPPAFWRAEDAYAHYAYICPVLQTATLAARLPSPTPPPPPVFVYHFAARSAPRGCAEHTDEAAVVCSAPEIVAAASPRPGLRATAAAMTGAWTRFAARGDPNPLPSSSSSSLASSRDAPPTWPRWAGDAGRRELALFGAGNTERMAGRAGGGRPGTPMQVVRLAPRERAQCAFWWPRVPLSQGYGDGGGGAKAKL
ncbi:carboxylesterase 3 [Xylariomycetidae sp. FL0641]|nr:carboxylesterase 3 [Xylariomycetidae sp. FL0641]